MDCKGKLSGDYRNLLEPPAYVALFARFPPLDFRVKQNSAGIPLFSLRFDLLTTLESAARVRLQGLPLFRFWSRLFKLPACFTGATITEYSPLPRDLSPEALLDALLEKDAQDDAPSLTIVKDIPVASPLLSEEDNAFAENLSRAAARRGFIVVEGQALAYLPVDFRSIDEYLARLSAGRRRDLRRKLKKRAELEVEIVPLGDARFADEAFRQQLYAMYLEVFEQSEIHFDLLSREFFAALLQEGAGWGVVFLYRRRGALAGYNICLLHAGRLIDKYIGFDYTLAKPLNLYFISWIVNLEFAREMGLSAYVAGWTDPEVKKSLGASFTFTRHLVWIKNPLLRALLRPFRCFFEADARVLERHPDA
ncbi:hypothetical protein FACS189475_04450 [Betaproteobacteria bacterium]|nr:hypothetical protein FACS189475_04450 [Betaproteobacteria bacterium]